MQFTFSWPRVGQKKDKQGIPHLKRRETTDITASEIEHAKEFNGQFTDVFNKNDHSEAPFLSRSAPYCFFFSHLRGLMSFILES